MRAARIVVLAVALGAGDIAASLASGSNEPPPAPAPVVRIDTVDILVAPPGQAETRAASRQRGSLSPALLSLIDANSANAADDDQNATNRRLNMVRYGVPTSTTAK